MFYTKKKLDELFFNKDGSLKNEMTESFDVIMAREEQKELDYYTNHFQHDKDVVIKYLETHDSIDSDINDYGKTCDCYDINHFCNWIFHHTDIELSIPPLEEYIFTVGLRVCEGLLIELIVGQGSFYRVSKYEVDLAAGI